MISCTNCHRQYPDLALENGATYLCDCGTRLRGSRYIRSRAHREPYCFVAAPGLGKLAGYLRLLGFDTVWNRMLSEQQLIEMALEEDRVLLTQSPATREAVNATDIIVITGDKARAQLHEVSKFYPIKSISLAYSLCSRCNCNLVHADKGLVSEQVPSYEATESNEYWQCPLCQKLYWYNAHLKHLFSLLDKTL